MNSYQVSPFHVDDVVVGRGECSVCLGVYSQPVIDVRVRVPEWEEWETQHRALVCGEGCAIRFVTSRRR